MVREYVKDVKQVEEKIMQMLEDAARDNKIITVHFAVGILENEECAINSYIACNPLNMDVSHGIISLGKEDEHFIDISKFEYIKCDDECIDDIVDATIDMEGDGYSVHFDFLSIQ